MTAQISAYLNQCKEFAEVTAAATVHSITDKFNSVCLNADVVCDAMSRDVDLVAHTDKELQESVLQLDHELQSFQQEVGGLLAQ